MCGDACIMGVSAGRITTDIAFRCEVILVTCVLVSLHWSNNFGFYWCDFPTHVGTPEWACHDDLGDILAP